MGHLFNNRLHLKKKNKILYFAPKIWRSISLIHLHSIYQNAEKKIYNRGSTIPFTYWFREIIIHNGKNFKIKYASRWMIGFKFGCFTWNRKYALYKSKKKKKKKK